MKKLLSMSIRTTIITIVLLMTLIPLGIIINTAIHDRNHAVEDAKSIVERAAERIRSDQQTALAGIEQLSSTLSHVPAVLNRDSETVNTLLSELLSKNPRYENILITDENGVVWALGKLAKESINLSGRSYWIKAVATGRSPQENMRLPQSQKSRYWASATL